jgi:hypothetical protein
MSPVHIGLMLMGVADDDSVKIDPGRHDARYAMQQSTIQNTVNIALGGLIPAELVTSWEPLFLSTVEG